MLLSRSLGWKIAGNIWSKSNLIREAKIVNVSVKVRNSSLSGAWAKGEEESAMGIDTRRVEKARGQLLQVLDAAITSVMPEALVNSKVRGVGKNLLVNEESHEITDSVYVVGFGKAVAGMASALEQLLGDKLQRGIVSVPRAPDAPVSSHFEKLNAAKELQARNLDLTRKSEKIEYRVGGQNNQPDDDSLLSTECIIDLVQSLSEKDTLIVLISGGGSALLFRPKFPLTSESKRQLCRRLQNAGATINELNCLRKILSVVKGGGLAKIAYPARVLTFILSDVVGDPIDVIASGPTSPSSLECLKNDAIEILKKYNLYNNIDQSVRRLLNNNDKKKTAGKHEDNEKFSHVTNMIIGNNMTALEAANEAAKRFDLESIILTNTVEGDVSKISYAYATLTRLVCGVLERKFESPDDFLDVVTNENIALLRIQDEKLYETYKTLGEMRKDRGLLLLGGGEPTVVVKGDGIGGRNQELSLRFSLDWFSEISKNPDLAKYFVLFLSVGTDGQDGPTDAAGAFGYPAIRPKLTKLLQDLLEEKKQTIRPNELDTLEKKISLVKEMLPENVLERNDSYNFYSRFDNGKSLVKTGLTGTNVMDLHFIYIRRRDCDCDLNEFMKKETVEEKCYFRFDELSTEPNDNCLC